MVNITRMVYQDSGAILTTSARYDYYHIAHGSRHNSHLPPNRTTERS